MSANAQPISAERFAAALPELTLSSLHAKAAEIQNSIAHLEHSNSQLKEFADDGDKDCQEAIDENHVVIQRQRERIQLLKKEVEQRGFKWGDDTDIVNGTSDAKVVPHVVPDVDSTSSSNEQAASTTQAAMRSRGGRLNDEELARQLAERMAEDDDDGVHL